MPEEVRRTEKEILRDKISSDLAAFFDAGGQTEVIPFGVFRGDESFYLKFGSNSMEDEDD